MRPPTSPAQACRRRSASSVKQKLIIGLLFLALLVLAGLGMVLRRFDGV